MAINPELLSAPYSTCKTTTGDTIYVRTRYALQQYTERKGYDRHYKQNIRLESIVNDGYHVCKKANGLWVAIHPIINHECKSCGHNLFEVWYTDSDKRNIKHAKCIGCREERITFDSYAVQTPDQAVGVWRKVNGKWCVKIISGTVGDEVIVVSKRGAETKKTKKLTIVE